MTATKGATTTTKKKSKKTGPRSRGIEFNAFLRLYAAAVKSKMPESRFITQMEEVGEYHSRDKAIAALGRFKSRVKKAYAKELPPLAGASNEKLAETDLAALGLTLVVPPPKEKAAEADGDGEENAAK